MATGSKLLTFLSENDTNGLISWLGTNGGAQAFEAPAANVSGNIDIVPTTLCSSNLGGGDLEIAARGTIERADGDVHSANLWDQWYKVSLPGNASLTVNHIAVRDRKGDWQNALSYFNLEASVDDVTWDVLASNTTPIGQGLWRQFPLPDNETAYKHFRLISTGGNAQGNAYLAFCEFEFYGFFFNGVYSSPDDYAVHFTMENIVGTTLADETGSHDGTIVNATKVSYFTGNALQFAGGGYVSVPSMPEMVSGGGVAFWMNPDNVSGISVAEFLYSFGIETYEAHISADGSIRILNSNNTTVWDSPAGIFESGKDSHVIVIHSTTPVLIVDGYQITLSATALTTGTSSPNFVIGARAPNQSSYRFNGKISQFKYFTRLLSLGESQSIFVEGSLLRGLVAHYTMDNVAGNTVYDETGFHDATIATLQQVDGYLGKALAINPTNGYMSFTTTESFSSGLTFSVWVKFKALQDGAFISKRSGGSAQDFQFYYSNSTNQLAFLPFGTTILVIPFTPVVDTYYHLRCSIGDGNILIAVNNVTTVEARAWTLRNQTNSVRIGNDWYGHTDNMEIDQARLYSRVVNDVEGSALYYEQLLTKILQGTITETLSVINWMVRCYRLDTGLLTGETETIDGTFTVDVGLENDAPHMVTVIPDQGIPWKRSVTKAIGSLVYPSDITTTPYYFKANSAGETGTTEPPWPTTPGQTVVDNGVTWECVERLVQPITHSPLMPV